MKLLFKDTYLAFIKGSVGAKSYQSNFAKIGGKKVDLVKKGRLSCAFFVSSVLKTFNLIAELHTTVDGTIKDMEKSGWYVIETPKIGSVLLWEKERGNKHLGFYIKKDRAISNNKKTSCPSIHHWTYGLQNNQPKRRIEKIFWHKSIKN